jgi:cbb3-type cytochrome oxidase subunit 3
MYFAVMSCIALLVLVFCGVVYWLVRERTKNRKKVDTGQAIRW